MRGSGGGGGGLSMYMYIYIYIYMQQSAEIYICYDNDLHSMTAGDLSLTSRRFADAVQCTWGLLWHQYLCEAACCGA